ncbi:MULTISPECIES: NfeD family protein [Bacillus]|uniref:NfeD family protein n=1 Tax=Bacillus TaxID=1386 RepID=UPI000BB807D0|nr:MULTISPECIES: nodulation protein NfeD [Bacillus]
MRKYLRLGSIISILLGVILLIPSLLPSKTSGAEPVVHVIPVHDTVEKGLYKFLERAIEDAEKNGADLIVLDLNTPGGTVDSAKEIARLLNRTTTQTVAYVNTWAISAGAYIALYADKIYFAPGGNMGSAAVIEQTGNAADLKSQAMWFTEMTTAAELTGRDPLYAQAMTDPEVDAPEVGAPKGKLLALGPNTALEVGYSEGTAANLDDLLAQLGYENAQIVIAKVSFAENLARFIANPIVASILISIGSLGLVLELYSPGFGIPGAMGISALLLFFYGHLVAGLAGMETLLLFLIGIILVVLEIFVPGGILGIIGLGAIITSFFLATDDVAQMGISLLFAMTVTVVAMVIIFKVFGKRIRVFDRLVLRDSTNTERGYISNVSRIELVGQEGVTLTTLRPSGTAIFNEERVDVVTEGSYIEANKQVRVVKAEGSRVIVREIHSSK